MEKLETMTGTGREMVSTPVMAHMAPTIIPVRHASRKESANRGYHSLYTQKTVEPGYSATTLHNCLAHLHV